MYIPSRNGRASQQSWRSPVWQNIYVLCVLHQAKALECSNLSLWRAVYINLCLVNVKKQVQFGKVEDECLNHETYLNQYAILPEKNCWCHQWVIASINVTRWAKTRHIPHFMKIKIRPEIRISMFNCAAVKKWKRSVGWFLSSHSGL